MCGIIGACLSSHVCRNFVIGEIVFNGLLRLEYRGYDSAGVAVIGDKLLVKKGKGKLSELDARLDFKGLRGCVGIGHTRWATHGVPNDVNAHPHVDCRNVFAVVHNGVLENFVELKRMLQSRGHVFASDTDTEVIPHLVEEYYYRTGDVFKSFKEAVKALKGTYAILLVTPLEPFKIFFAKKDSPLIIGLGEGFNLLASDIPAVLPHTRKVVVIRDNWAGFITPSEAYAEDLASGEPVELVKYARTVEWSISEAEKSGYPHFMLKEIYEQPRAVMETVYGALRDRLITQAVELLVNAEKVYITGAGTSFHAAEHFSITGTRLAGKPVISFISSEYDTFLPGAGEGDVLIVVSQSGETMDSLKALRAFKGRGVKIISVSNVIDSAIPRESHVTLYTRAGPEIGVAATKTFTTQTILLTYLAVRLGEAIGQLDSGDKEKILGSITSAGELVKKTLEDTGGLARKLASSISRSSSAYYLSRGVGVPVAKEGALKIKEIAYVHAESYPAGESKHGPIALVESSFPVVFVIPNDPYLETLLLGNIEEMKARGAYAIGVGAEGSRAMELVNEFIPVPRAHWALTPITHTIPLQLLAYYAAVEKGLDPDKPRNLAKTVTVE
uniref:Glutamine--fructose-6-phosphate aminotransferase [isomerizing] n=1 Tax=Thermosphaera aggregans TaxID=54254 RepID=A0A7C2BKI8_9CREN